jgi:hypothetical protein
MCNSHARVFTLEFGRFVTRLGQFTDKQEDRRLQNLEIERKRIALNGWIETE